VIESKLFFLSAGDIMKLTLTEEELMLKNRFAVIRQMRQETNKKDSTKLKLTPSLRVNTVAAARAVLAAQKEVKKDSGFKHSTNLKLSTTLKREMMSEKNSENTQLESKKQKTFHETHQTPELNDEVDSDNVICVTDLPEECEEQEVMNFFECFGRITSFKPYFESEEKYAIIYYLFSADATRAVTEMEKNPLFQNKEVQVYKPNLDDLGEG